jgi:hypothetical protein
MAKIHTTLSVEATSDGRTSHGRYTVRIFGWQPQRLNDLMHCHWSKKNRLKKSDRDIVAYYASWIPKAVGKRRVTLTITLGPRQRGGDVDAWWKSTLDALVCCQLLRDDCKEWVELAPLVYERGPERATSLTLEDL